MTCIVMFKTKKSLKEHLTRYKDVDIYDPSIFGEYYGRAGTYIQSGRACFITNPARNWFGQLKLNSKGDVVVS